jgi:hypothetical protein
MAAESQLGGARLRAVQHRSTSSLASSPHSTKRASAVHINQSPLDGGVVLNASSRTEMWTTPAWASTKV